MGYGALDAIDTPTLGTRGEITGAALLLHKIEIINKLIGKPAERPRDRHESSASMSPASFASRAEQPSLEPLVVLGASTGGPHALAEVLSHLPATLEATIIIVQHVDAAFAPAWASGSPSRHGGAVTLITEGHRPAPREVLLSGTDDHLLLGEDRRLYYSVEPGTVCYRPSVDVFFGSVARNWPGLASPCS